MPTNNSSHVLVGTGPEMIGGYGREVWVFALSACARRNVVGFHFLCESNKDAHDTVRLLRRELDGDLPEANAFRNFNSYHLAVAFVAAVLWQRKGMEFLPASA